MQFTQSKIRIAAFAALTIAFNFLFWMEKPGINYLIYAALFLGVLIFLDPQKLKLKYCTVSFFGVLVSLLSLLMVNSILSVIMFFVSSVLFVSFYYQQELKSLYYILPNSFLNLFYSVSELFVKVGERSQNTSSGKKVGKWLKILIIPVIITLVFFAIYFRSNHFIEEFTIEFIQNIGEYIRNIFEHYPFLRFVFMALGALLACFFVYYKTSNLFINFEKNQTDDIERKKLKHFFSFPLNGLKSEYRIALVTLLFLNVLLFFVNIVDIWKVWFSFNYTEGSTYSAQLHQGIYTLILSILLSIGILVYFFRGNINFLQNNKYLKWMSYAWLVQNICLAFTAFLKCLYYIHYYSLTYKRIGVLIFLLLTIFGLAMMFFKIEKRKTVYFLLRSNSWFIYLFFVAASLVNWDAEIAEYNLSVSKGTTADYEYILSLSEKALPTLLEDKTFLAMQKENYFGYDQFSIAHKIKRYLNVQDKVTFLSWNKSDDYLNEFFRKKGYQSDFELQAIEEKAKNKITQTK